MAEEALADSGEVEDSVEDSGIDMESALSEMSDNVFPNSPVVQTEEGQETQEGLAGKPPETEAKPETEEKPEAKPEEESEGNPLPASWKKDMQERWGKLDAETQAYVIQREEQMREGLEKDRSDAKLGQVMRDTMAPYSEALRQSGIDEPTMVRNLMSAHYRMSTADEAGKRELISQLAQSYGINLNGEQQQVDPVLQSVQQKVQQLEHTISASHEKAIQESRERVQAEVEEFAADPEHAFFDEVSEQIVPLINAGYSLEDAYKNAIWLNPVTRQKEIDRANKEATEKAQEAKAKEAEKAKKAKAANVRGRDTSRTPTEPTGTMEDTMRETFRDIQNRSH